MIRLIPVVFFIYLLSSCSSTPSYDPERNYKSIEKALSAKLMLAKDSSIIELDEGHFIFKNGLILEGKNHITIRGKGADKTVLSFKIQESGAEGLRIANCTNIILENFAVEDAAGDNIKVTDTQGITFRNLKSAWTGEVSEENGAYGLYPVLCTDVTIENCEVLGASDAGVYVGQSENVSIKNNTVYWNVAGIESENSENVIIEGNNSFENTGGILIFDLPGLTRYGRNIKAFNNNVHDNNLKNFAPKGNIVASVPPGTGFLILATRNVEIFENEITDNRTVSIGLISYDLVAAMKGESTGGHSASGAQGVNQNYKKDTNYNSFPGNVIIHDNQISDSHLLPALDSDFGKLFFWKFQFSAPEIVWDGIESPEFRQANGTVNPDYQICVDENEKIKIAVLDAANDFKNLSTDPLQLKCGI